MDRADTIVAVIGIVMALVINWGAVKGLRLERWQFARMALIWGSIILGVTLLVKAFAP